MKNKMLAVFLILACPALWATDGTGSRSTTPTDQLLYPTARVLPAFHLNAQGGYVNLAKLNGWWPSLRLGLADVVSCNPFAINARASMPISVIPEALRLTRRTNDPSTTPAIINAARAYRAALPTIPAETPINRIRMKPESSEPRIAPTVFRA